jgi:hypothetical protein
LILGSDGAVRSGDTKQPVEHSFEQAGAITITFGDPARIGLIAKHSLPRDVEHPLHGRAVLWRDREHPREGGDLVGRDKPICLGEFCAETDDRCSEFNVARIRRACERSHVRPSFVVRLEGLPG